MSYAVVFSSKTGNTELVAKAIREELGTDGCVYFGMPDAEALKAETLYVGFWTDKGTCDGASAAFLSTLEGKRVFLFGTAGFGGAQTYFDQILGVCGKKSAGERGGDRALYVPGKNAGDCPAAV